MKPSALSEFLNNSIGNIGIFGSKYRKNIGILGSKYRKNIGSLVGKIQQKSRNMEIFCAFYIMQNSLIGQ